MLLTHYCYREVLEQHALNWLFQWPCWCPDQNIPFLYRWDSGSAHEGSQECCIPFRTKRIKYIYIVVMSHHATFHGTHSVSVRVIEVCRAGQYVFMEGFTVFSWAIIWENTKTHMWPKAYSIGDLLRLDVCFNLHFISLTWLEQVDWCQSTGLIPAWYSAVLSETFVYHQFPNHSWEADAFP